MTLDIGATDGALGTEFVVLKLGNTSDTACTLPNSVEVVATGNDGETYDATPWPYDAPGPEGVNGPVLPGGHAVTGLLYTESCAAGESGAATSPVATRLHVDWQSGQADVAMPEGARLYLGCGGFEVTRVGLPKANSDY